MLSELAPLILLASTIAVATQACGGRSPSHASGPAPSAPLELRVADLGPGTLELRLRSPADSCSAEVVAHMFALTRPNGRLVAHYGDTSWVTETRSEADVVRLGIRGTKSSMDTFEDHAHDQPITTSFRYQLEIRGELVDGRVFVSEADPDGPIAECELAIEGTYVPDAGA